MVQLATPQSNFRTTIRHRKLWTLLQGQKRHPSGYRKVPVLVRLNPLPGVAPSKKPPVRIFLGTEPAQYRAERVFVWSILQVRDPARVYEIFLMKDLEGFDRSTWKTGFTNYCYAIPALAGGKGRAIYNGVNQVYLADPAELFDTDMKEAGLLSLDEKETSVMLLDCEKIAAIWKLEDAQTIGKHNHEYFRQKIWDAGLWGSISPAWNTRDFEFVPEKSKLLHFTTLHKQPWRPFPNELKYEPHKQAELWYSLERAADTAGFTIFTKENPSPRYGELLAMYKTMHEVGYSKAGRKAKKFFPGISLAEHVKPIARLVRESQAKTILDFGSGKGGLYRDAPGYSSGSRYKVMEAWGNSVVTCYDPGYQPFAEPYEEAYDGVITTDVLEHIPEEDIAWVLDELFSHARKFVYAVAACFPAKKQLPDGSNAHCTLQPPQWWKGQMELAARRSPNIKWVLCTQERSALAFSQRHKLMKKGIRYRFFSGIGVAST